MKIILLFFFITVYSVNSYAQDYPKSAPPDFNDFVSKNDRIVKIEDFTTPRLILQLSYGEIRIERFSDNQMSIYERIGRSEMIGKQYNRKVKSAPSPR